LFYAKEKGEWVGTGQSRNPASQLLNGRKFGHFWGFRINEGVWGGPRPLTVRKREKGEWGRYTTLAC